MPQQRFYAAVEKLMNGFLTGSLSHEGACNCAVGNLCDGKRAWRDYSYNDIGLVLINSTNYSLTEIFEIERVFESREINLIEYDNRMLDIDSIKCGLDEYNDADGFLGLCNVFDYMVSIENWSEEEKKVNLIEMCLTQN